MHICPHLSVPTCTRSINADEKWSGVSKKVDARPRRIRHHTLTMKMKIKLQQTAPESCFGVLKKKRERSGLTKSLRLHHPRPEPSRLKRHLKRQGPGRAPKTQPGNVMPRAMMCSVSVKRTRINFHRKTTSRRHFSVWRCGKTVVASSHSP